MSGTPVLIQNITPEISGNIPIPLSGYKVALGQTPGSNIPATIIDATKFFGGLSSKKTIEEVYALPAWNMQLNPQLQASLTGMGIQTSPGQIIAMQAISIIDDLGNIHDAHGMYDQAFTEIPFVSQCVTSSANTFPIDGSTLAAYASLSGIEGKSLSVRVFYDLVGGNVYFTHNYATNMYQTQGNQWGAGQPSRWNPLPALANGPNGLGSNPASDIQSNTVTPASDANSFAATTPQPLQGNPGNNTTYTSMQAVYSKRLGNFKSTSAARGYLKVIRLIS